MNQQISNSDQALLDLLRRHASQSICDLTEALGVTQTAVRQRLSRLLAMDLIDRIDVRSGRGRPSHQYRLTEKGQRTAGDNLADLADVMWKEIQRIPDAEIRQTVMKGVVTRLAARYADQFDGKSLDERMLAATKIFDDRNIPSSLETDDGQPVLKILGCPYPELVDDEKHICDMEKQLFEVLLDSDLKVDCQCGTGGQCCTFHPVASSESV